MAILAESSPRKCSGMGAPAGEQGPWGVHVAARAIAKGRAMEQADQSLG